MRVSGAAYGSAARAACVADRCSGGRGAAALPSPPVAVVGAPSATNTDAFATRPADDSTRVPPRGAPAAVAPGSGVPSCGADGSSITNRRSSTSAPAPLSARPMVSSRRSMPRGGGAAALALSLLAGVAAAPLPPALAAAALLVVRSTCSPCSCSCCCCSCGSRPSTTGTYISPAAVTNTAASTASTRSVTRHPAASMSAPLSDEKMKVPAPLPATARPTASDRRVVNMVGTIITDGEKVSE